MPKKAYIYITPYDHMNHRRYPSRQLKCKVFFFYWALSLSLSLFSPFFYLILFFFFSTIIRLLLTELCRNYNSHTNKRVIRFFSCQFHFFFSIFSSYSFYRASQPGHVNATPSRFNFKLGLDKKFYWKIFFLLFFLQFHHHILFTNRMGLL
jgi:hypothetical protein